VALLTLGEGRQIAAEVRQLTPKVTALAGQAWTKEREFERLSTEMQNALEHFAMWPTSALATSASDELATAKHLNGPS
jgi:hypothetical protein